MPPGTATGTGTAGDLLAAGPWKLYGFRILAGLNGDWDIWKWEAQKLGIGCEACV